MSMTNEYDHMFTFKVFVSNVSQSSCNPAPEIEDVLLVDTGAITYILDNKFFLIFDHDFDTASHFLDLVDGRRSNLTEKDLSYVNELSVNPALANTGYIRCYISCLCDQHRIYPVFGFPCT